MVNGELRTADCGLRIDLRISECGLRIDCGIPQSAIRIPQYEEARWLLTL